jgi:magnesium transporter
VNLFTALLSASVISLFGASIEQLVALAVLMPIVALARGQCGDAGADRHRPGARRSAN